MSLSFLERIIAGASGALGYKIYQIFYEDKLIFRDGYNQGSKDTFRFIEDKEWAKAKVINLKPSDIEDMHAKLEKESSIKHQVNEYIYLTSLLQEAYADKCRKENDATKCDANKCNANKCNAEDIFYKHLKPAPFGEFVRMHKL